MSSLTPQQVLILESVRNTTDNISVQAVPGAGKTYMLAQIANSIPTSTPTLALSYNKAIATELGAKLPSNCYSATTHSDAYSSFYKRPRVDASKLKWIAKDLYPDEDYQLISSACRLATIYKEQALGLDGSIPCDEKSRDLIDYYDLPVPTERQEADLIATANRLFDTSRNSTRSIDFTDMLYIPVYRKHNFKPYDFILLDEAQDMSPLQRAYLKLRAGNTRLTLVGDSHQCINAFRGADVKSFEALSSAFNAKELPMNYSFRCPAAICEEANRVFADAMFPGTDKEGTVEHISPRSFDSSTLNADSMVLCRVNTPLFVLAHSLLQRGHPVRVNPTFVKSLTALLKRSAGSVDALGPLEQKELERSRSPMRKASVTDKYTTLRLFLSNAGSVSAAVTELEALSNSTNGPLLSTIHSAKGLEARQVYVLRPDLLPHPLASKDWEQLQEANIAYVAITRSYQNLYYLDQQS